MVLVLDAMGSASFPASELVSQTVEGMVEIIGACKQVFLNKCCFQELALYLERIVPFLNELNAKDHVATSETLTNATIEILNREVKVAKRLTADCTTRNKVYLLMNCRNISRQLQDVSKEISRAISLLPVASLDLSSTIVQDITGLCNEMQRAEFKAAVAEEEILERIESGIQERKVDRSYANSLLAQIAETVGISKEQLVLKKELEDFKDEIENAKLRKDQAEAIQMDQIIALLERADAASSPREKERKYFTKRRSLGSQPLEPLQAFYCPITRDVMVDPVETCSGQTFERSAIEKWMAEGNNLCPLTMTPLDTSVLRPNKTLRQSIEEWKDRNTIITIATMKSKLESEEDEKILECLGQLEDLCQQNDQHREWMVLENYIPVIIQLLGSKNRDVRHNALDILCILAKDSNDAKERVALANDAIELIVRSLGRRIGERKLAVALLLELSKCNEVRDSIGKVQGCILLLVTMSRSDDSQAATDAQQLLANLSFSDYNIIQMAKANYFRHFLQRLSTGPDDAKIMMASTLAETELTDHNKASLFDGGVFRPLLHLVSSDDVHMKTVVVKAIQNLSSFPDNGRQMIKQGIVRPLLNILFRHTSLSSSTLREQVAITIMYLARSTVSQDESSPVPVSLLETDEDTSMLFSLVNLTGPAVQQRILQTFQALCHSPSASYIKIKLMESSALQVLIQLCEHENSDVRSNALKLFCYLVKDGEKEIIMEHIGKDYIDTLVKIIQNSDDTEEVASALGIISHLPEEPQIITEWLLDSGALRLIFKFLQDKNKKNDPYKNQLVENAVGAMRRFTLPTKLEWQKKAAGIGVIPVLVKLLDSGTTTLTRKYAATCLAQFASSSFSLSQPLSRHKGILWCFSVQHEAGCSVHGGICTVESSFCLVKADAVRPLVRVLEDSDDFRVCEASLDALLTLIEGERLESGSQVLGEADGIVAMIRFLSLSTSCPSLQEKALCGLERIFRLPEFRQRYGSCAQMPLVDLTQRGSHQMKSLSARILAHLNVLQDQSSFF